jgi:hypothetical protein
MESFQEHHTGLRVGQSLIEVIFWKTCRMCTSFWSENLKGEAAEIIFKLKWEDNIKN